MKLKGLDMKTVRGIVTGFALAAVVAGRAEAAGTWAGNGPYCGGNTFSTCFSLDISWSVSSGLASVVTMKVTNSDAQSGLKWFWVGLDNLPAGLTFTAGGALGFTQAQAPGASGGMFTATIYPDGKNGGVAPGLNIQNVFTFNFSAGTTQNWDNLFQAAGFAMHAGGVTINNNSCSTKVEVRNINGTWTTTAADGSNPGCTPTTVPEPATMGLLALGLVGMGGASLLRRRRKV
jgi:hypothetical protein